MAKRKMPTMSSNILEKESNVEKEIEPIIVMKVNCKKLNIRSTPSLSSDILTTVVLGTRLIVKSADNEWSNVQVESNRSINGYCLTKFLRA